MNWQLLVQALDYYKSKGFTPIEVPWIVPNKIADYTLPEERKQDNLFKLRNAQTIIGSAEQGFIELYLYNKLPEKHHVALSPCFRDEPVIDMWHQTHFMKVELFSKYDTKSDLENMIVTAESWFKTIGLNTNRVHINDNQMDLCYNNIELGSYGIRTIESKTFIYGTGHAEPRTTLIKNQILL